MLTTWRWVSRVFLVAAVVLFVGHRVLVMTGAPKLIRVGAIIASAGALALWAVACVARLVAAWNAGSPDRPEADYLDETDPPPRPD